MEQKILLSQLAADTLKGLSSNPKFLLSKYFYDDEGSRIFQDIMHMPEYYLTDCESEIFSEQTPELCQALHHKTGFFNLVELGSGDGLKTKILLKYLFEKDIKFQYTPVDISAIANHQLVESLKTELPALQVEAKTGDYFNKLKSLNGHASIPKTILFLGSNIGNFSEEETKEFIGQLAAYSNAGDKVLIGFDMKKSPCVIMDAYNDPHGHTRRFNLNHLVRLNRELDADFDIKKFEQQTTYNPQSGEVKSFLISNTEQTARIGTLKKFFHFEKWEAVFMERSRKYDIKSIEEMALKHGFKVIQNFTDKRNYFVDSLWEKEK